MHPATENQVSQQIKTMKKYISKKTKEILKSIYGTDYTIFNSGIDYLFAIGVLNSPVSVNDDECTFFISTYFSIGEGERIEIECLVEGNVKCSFCENEHGNGTDYIIAGVIAQILTKYSYYEIGSFDTTKNGKVKVSTTFIDKEWINYLHYGKDKDSSCV